MGHKQVVGFFAVLAMAVVVSLIEVPVTQSQAACQQGTYTLKGDLTVTGKVKAANIEAAQSPAELPKPSFESCELIQGSSSASCPSGKVVTGASCFTPNAYAGGFCQVNYVKPGTQVSSGTKGITGANCYCFSQHFGGAQQGFLTLFCC